MSNEALSRDARRQTRGPAPAESTVLR